MALAVTGILLVTVFTSFYLVFQKVYIQNNEVMTATVVNGEWERDYNLGYGVVVAKTICISPGFLVDVYEGTEIYEQDSASQQKRRVGLDALQSGQVVDIEARSLVADPEIMEPLLAKYGPRGFDLRVLFGALQITIRKSEYAPVDLRVRNDCVGIMSDN